MKKILLSKTRHPREHNVIIVWYFRARRARLLFLALGLVAEQACGFVPGRHFQGILLTRRH